MTDSRDLGWTTLVAAGLAVLASSAAPARAGSTERVSVSSSGKQGNSDSGLTGLAISADGRFEAFVSAATNLVAGDSNGHTDVFVRDRQTGTTERVSVSSSGKQADGDSDAPAISADGRFIAFWSAATNLVPGSRKGVFNVFVRDRMNGTTEQANMSSNGIPDNGGTDIIPSLALTPDGRFVAFESRGSNLVPGDTNGLPDVFVRDRWAGTTERVDVSSRGAQANGGFNYPIGISAKGRFVAFESGATNLVPGDTNGFEDVFVRDRRTGKTERVNVSSSGAQADCNSSGAWITGDGRYVVFSSCAANLVPGDTNGGFDVFVRDRELGTTERVSVGPHGRQANGDSGTAFGRVITRDGRYVVFSSGASNLVPGDTNGADDVFVRDRQTGTTERVSVSSSGRQADGDSDAPVISGVDATGGEGRFVAFVSAATNLVKGDTNNALDVFVRTR